LETLQGVPLIGIVQGWLDGAMWLTALQGGGGSRVALVRDDQRTALGLASR